ncbi:MAG: SprB repeat-containing protein, partial [Alphaproteobacteria bacterium]
MDSLQEFAAIKMRAAYPLPSTALAISGIVKNNPLCNGNANGSLVVTVTGGTAPYQYSIDGTNFLSASTFSGLVAGNYLVTVKDVNN